jgi:hypothetical protein
MPRQCGDCQLCCRVLPILELGKSAGQKCEHQKFGVGCKVHGTQSQPLSCRRWNCWWLMYPTFTLPRPDRAGYVVDPTADVAVIGEDVFASKHVPALQVWADPKRPDAWRAALPWIKEMLKDNEAVAVIRFGSKEAIAIIPPQLSDSGDWTECDSRMMGAVQADAVKRKMIEDAIAKAKEKAREATEKV